MEPDGRPLESGGETRIRPAIGGDAGVLALPRLGHFEDGADADRYRALPDDWALALADIEGSTQAIADGRYKAVNMAGAAVISAVLNETGTRDLPFVFGGDGATVAVPPEGIEAARRALAAVRTWVGEELDLSMRAALVPIPEIRRAGHDVRAARFRVSDQVDYAMFAGGGANWAERQMKKGRFLVDAAPAGTRPDLEGLSCRWSPVEARNGQIVSIIVVPGANGDDAAFRGLVTSIVSLAGEEDRNGNPIPAAGPQMRMSLSGIVAEAAEAGGGWSQTLRRLKILGACALMWILHRIDRPLGSFDARQYARDIALNADFRKFDDGLKMTIDVSAERLARIEALLGQAAGEGICRYGIHKQQSALMTCIVPSALGRDHMHFVDGAAGGYAEAARILKSGEGAPPVAAPAA